MTKKRKKRKTKRVCLRCNREFMSEGIYNRICPNCQKSNANMAIPQPPDPLPDYEFGTRSIQSDED